MSGPPPPAPLPPAIAAENKGPMMQALTWTFTGVASLFVIGRIISRRKKTGKLRLDDYIIVGSLILGFIFLGFVTTSIHYGSGRHAATLSIPDLEKAIMYITIGFVPGILSFTVPKFAVILLLCDLLNPSRVHRWFLWIMAAINFVAITVCIIIVYASCDPPYAMWTLSIVPKCWDPRFVVYSSILAGAFSAFMDLYLAIYPAVVLWRLQMNIKKKLGLSIALGFGICAGAVAIHKCTTIPGVANHTDFTYGTEDLILWTNIESNCVIIAACVPMLLPLIEMVLGRSFMTSSGKSSYRRFGFGSRPRTVPGAHGRREAPSSSRLGPGAAARKPTGSRASDNSSSAADPYGGLELGDAAPCKTEISSSHADSRPDHSQESILRAEEAAMPVAGGGDSGGIVRHDQVVVEYKPRGQEDRRW